MNAEPHEPAMRALLEAGVVVAPPPPPPALEAPGEGATAAPPAEGSGGGAAEGGGAAVAPPGAPPAEPPPPPPTEPQPTVLGLGGAPLTDVAPMRVVEMDAAPPRGADALCDAWRALFPEPPPRAEDAAARRYALTFPSDAPTKRIDLVLARCSGGAGGGGCEGLPACGATVQKAWLVGQDPVPGTDMGEGKGLGMVHERSAWYASDHRGVVVEFRRG
jgi:hypothetical protein